MRSILAVLVCVVASVAFAWIAVPDTMARVLLKLNNLSAGLSAKTVETQAGAINYLEGGQGETLVLVHGIYARKEHWVELARHLVSDYHVIALDLPGFGDNEALSDDQYLLGQQQQNLLSFFDALDIQKAHIGANSMGAYVAALLTHAHPDRVSSLAFLGSPLGVPTDLKSDMDLALEHGIKPLVVRNETDFDERMQWLSPNPPYVPGPILKSWKASEVATGEKNARVWDMVHNQSTAPTVVDLAPGLTMDTLIVWCRPDRIFHISGADVLAQKLPDPTLSILADCGHVPMLDRPDEVAQIYLDFLKDVGAN